MKVGCYIPLLYGKDYLEYAIKSVYPVVDEIYVLYTGRPSHGSMTHLNNPDSKEELYAIIDRIDVDKKIGWFESENWNQENQQRNYGHELAKLNGCDILVALDSDEIWETQMLKELIDLTYERKASKCLVWMRHLWRSFNYICDDPMRQERIYYLGIDKKDLIYAPHSVNQVWHFGYARELKSIEYKISIHGHSSEWLIPKERWFEEKFKPYPPTFDVHPVCKDTWNPQPFDKAKLPDLMKLHPWYKLDVIA